MLPLSDENPRSIVPITTWLLIGVNILVFVWEAISPLSLDRIVNLYGFVPALGIENFTALRVFTSVFLHADLFHIGGKMVYLWIFGDNVENSCGHISFLLFYMLSGVIASITMLLLNSTSTVPAIGASGAIYGILGGYILLYPRARIRTVVFSFYIVNFIRVPAFALIGFWFILQVLYSLADVMTGVAYTAHVGGFVAGLLLIYLFARARAGRNNEQLDR
jgi:membrane associated rhomboid family serine protease